MTDHEQDNQSQGGGWADQPLQPPLTADECDPGEYVKTVVPTPKCSEDCPEPESECKCPDKPGNTENCLEGLIDAQDRAILEAEKAKEFKSDIEALLAKAKVVSQEFTAVAYDDLLKRWETADTCIADLIHRIVCSVHCWDCVVECYICPLLREIRLAERELYGDGTRPTGVYDLQDLLYWCTRDKEEKERRYLRVKGVLAAWEKPVAAIDKVLKENEALCAVTCKVACSNPGAAIFDVFFKLIPKHLAIAPPFDVSQTKIKKIYTEFCKCKEHDPPATGTSGGDAYTQASPAKSESHPAEYKCACCKDPELDICCGPNVGLGTIMERLIGPYPYLIKPEQYFTVICCIAKHKYLRAKQRLSDAEGELANVNSKITRAKAKIGDGLKNFEKNAKAVLPPTINCDPLPKKEKGGGGTKDGNTTENGGEDAS